MEIAAPAGVSPEQTIAVQQGIGRDALSMAAELAALLDTMDQNRESQDLDALRYLAAQGRELSRDLTELLTCFEGEAAELAGELLTILGEE